MGILEVLTVVFVVLKLLGIITWSWWLVLSPIILAVVLYVIIWAVAIVIVARGERKMRNLKNK